MFIKDYIQVVRALKKPGNLTADLKFAFISLGVFNSQTAALVSVFAVSFFVLSCNPENRIQQTPALRQEIADKKVKRITNIQLTETVDSWGQQLTAIAQKELAATLAQNTTNATTLCQLKGLPKTQALAKRYSFEINLLGASDVQNPTLPQKEREVLDAYLYNAENKLPQQANIQKINDTLFVYNAAVPTDNIICKACFGSQQQPLAVWRLVFHKREVIRRIGGKK